MSESPLPPVSMPVQKEQPTRWLVPAQLRIPDAKSPSGYRIETRATVMADPSNPNISKMESKGSSQILIPPSTPEGSLIIALTNAHVSEKDKKIDPLIQIFQVVSQNGKEVVIESVPNGNIHPDIITQVAGEITDGSHRGIEKKTGLVRKLCFENADPASLQKPQYGPTGVSLSQQLSSQSPYIDIGFVTAGDLAVYKKNFQSELTDAFLKEVQAPQPVQIQKVKV